VLALSSVIDDNGLSRSSCPSSMVGWTLGVPGCGGDLRQVDLLIPWILLECADVTGAC
jgi:hypothetical protein